MPRYVQLRLHRKHQKFARYRSLGVILIRRILTAPRAAEDNLLGRKRSRRRQPIAAPAGERMEFTLLSPIQHPQQDDVILL